MRSARHTVAKQPARVGEIVQGADTAKPKRVTTRGGRWSGAAEARFLEELAASCNVTRAASAAGFSTVAIYRRRMQHAGFAERWQAALENGYARLELAVVEAANDTLSGVDFALDRPIPKMTIREALSVLQLYKRNVPGHITPGGRYRLRPADPDKARAEILKKAAAVRRARGAPQPS